MSDQVHSITDAPQKHSDEQHARMVRYAVSMGIRMVCFILAVVLQNWLTWVFLALAVVLPYVAVTAANVGADRYMGRRDSADPGSPAMLSTAHEDGEPEADRQWWEEEEPAPHAGSSNGVTDAEVIAGELVSPDDQQHPVDPGGPEAAGTPPKPLDGQDTER